MPRPDVAIVGAGPAGAALAILLAGRGVAVRLVDRKRFPRDKVCGDFLSPRCLPLLEELGVLDDVRSRSGTPIEGMRLFSYRGREIVGRYALVPGLGSGLGICRRELDPILVDRARQCGADVRTGADVDPEGLDAALVVGADGRRSRVARVFGIGSAGSREGGYALRAYLPAGPRLEALGEIHLTPWGYVGLGPVGSGTVNTSVVVKTGRRMDFCAALRGVGTLAGKLGALEPRDLMAAAPLRSQPRSVVNGHALLVGDAALQLDPITGEGVYHALRSARIAADEIPGALEDTGPREALRRYTRRHESEFGPRRRFSRTLQRLLPSRIACEAAGVVLAAHAGVAARVVAVAGNVVPLGGALRRG